MAAHAPARAAAAPLPPHRPVTSHLSGSTAFGASRAEGAQKPRRGEAQEVHQAVRDRHEAGCRRLRKGAPRPRPHPAPTPAHAANTPTRISTCPAAQLPLCPRAAGEDVRGHRHGHALRHQDLQEVAAQAQAEPLPGHGIRRCKPPQPHPTTLTRSRRYGISRPSWPSVAAWRRATRRRCT